MINQFGDCVTTYIVEMGRRNDTRPRITRSVEAKCDYMAAEIAERMTPGYIAFSVYQYVYTEKGEQRAKELDLDERPAGKVAYFAKKPLTNTRIARAWEKHGYITKNTLTSR